MTFSGEITAVDNYAFYGATALEETDIHGVATVGESAFYGATALEEIIYGGSVSAWNSVVKPDGWADEIAAECVVKCTDGEIPV